jgi:hypothetical protein
MTDQEEPLIQRPLNVPLCPRCGRDLELVVEDRNRSGHVEIALVCAKHGSFPSGWRNDLLTNVQKHRRGR